MLNTLKKKLVSKKPKCLLESFIVQLRFCPLPDLCRFQQQNNRSYWSNIIFEASQQEACVFTTIWAKPHQIFQVIFGTGYWHWTPYSKKRMLLVNKLHKFKNCFRLLDIWCKDTEFFFIHSITVTLLISCWQLTNSIACQHTHVNIFHLVTIEQKNIKESKNYIALLPKGGLDKKTNFLLCAGMKYITKIMT